MNTIPAGELHRLVAFLSSYAATLVGTGVHTSRVVRNTKRIGESFGCEVHLNLSLKTFTLTVRHPESEEYMTEVNDAPELPIKFVLNSELSALSWRVHDREMSLEEAEQAYELILHRSNRQPFWMACLLIAVSNSCFCRLFGGDPRAMCAVALATAMGFIVRRLVTAQRISGYIAVTLAAAVSSGATALLMMLPFFRDSITADTAVATSVLYLVPGVPLISGIIDTVEGHNLSGFARLVRAGLIILSIGFGIAFTLLLTKGTLV